LDSSKTKGAQPLTPTLIQGLEEGLASQGHKSSLEEGNPNLVQWDFRRLLSRKYKFTIKD
jgi:hypothetical protein